MIHFGIGLKQLFIDQFHRMPFLLVQLPGVYGIGNGKHIGKMKICLYDAQGFLVLEWKA